VVLTGVGVKQPSLVITAPAPVTAPIGGTTPIQFTLTNTGGAPVTITKSKPPFGQGFTAVTALFEGTSIPGGGSAVETVDYQPMPNAAGVVQPTQNDAWTLTGDDGSGVHSVSFTGTPVVSTYIGKVYRDVLGTSPDAATTNSWTQTLLHGSPIGVVPATTLRSFASEGNIVEHWFETILGRHALPQNLTYWAAALAHGTRAASLAIALASSPEFFVNQAHSNVTQWLQKVFQLALQRPMGSSDLTYWTNWYRRGATLQKIAGLLFLSGEAVTKSVQANYLHFLRRAADANGLAYWVPHIIAGVSDQTLVLALLDSAEYVTKSALP
jgi:hypothetical protein